MQFVLCSTGRLFEPRCLRWLQPRAPPPRRPWSCGSPSAASRRCRTLPLPLFSPLPLFFPLPLPLLLLRPPRRSVRRCKISTSQEAGVYLHSRPRGRTAPGRARCLSGVSPVTCESFIFSRGQKTQRSEYQRIKHSLTYSPTQPLLSPPPLASAQKAAPAASPSPCPAQCELCRRQGGKSCSVDENTFCHFLNQGGSGDQK